MYSLEFDIYQTLAIAVLMLFIGSFLVRKINILAKFCIPAPVIGGLIFALFSCIMYSAGIVEFSFDDTLKNVCMVFFFTMVGFQANIKVLKKGGAGLIILIALVGVMIVLQDLISVFVSDLMGTDPLLGLCMGSISMIGGHGTSGAFGPVLEECGVAGATTVCTAAATYGLIAGSLMGGPLGRGLIERKHLADTFDPEENFERVAAEDEDSKGDLNNYPQAVFILIIAVGIGTIVAKLLTMLGLTFPNYIGGLIMGAVIRNLSESLGWFPVHMKEMKNFGNICLSVFLGIAMISLKIWQLAGLAVPMIVLLAVQTVFMYFFARFAAFNLLGRNYDAAVITAGFCGFGLGATPNAMANMQAVCSTYKPSIKAFLLIPVVGGIFLDLINSLVITGFINLLS